MNRRMLAVALAAVVLAAGYTRERQDAIRLADPGDCTAVDVAASDETAHLLSRVADRFNSSAAAKLDGGGCAFVRVHAVPSAIATDELFGGWRRVDTFGPAPAVWVPGSSSWAALLNERFVRAGRDPIAPPGESFARSPLVVAMPAPMADALGYPRRAIGWRDLAALADDPRGWGAYGHPEWGPFRFGKPSPHWSTPALDATVVQYASGEPTPAAASLERAVIHYGDSPDAYLRNWMRLGEESRNRALRYLSAAITDERTVVAYNAGQTDGEVPDGGAETPAFRLVALYPSDGALEGDHPMVVLDARWATAEMKAGARAFREFARRRDGQEAVAEAGFRPAKGPIDPSLLNARNGVDPNRGEPAPDLPTGPDVIGALERWQDHRRPARVLLLFDVSESMRDPSDPSEPDESPSKLERAQAALRAALDQLAPGDIVGFRIFTTGLGPPTPNWSDVVPFGPARERRAAIERAIDELEPLRGSPLYAATRDAYDTIAEMKDTERINGVLLVTDGYNEYDEDDDRDALLDDLTRVPGVRIFPIVYSNDADAKTLELIAETTNARTYDARDTLVLIEQLPRALSNF